MTLGGQALFDGVMLRSAKRTAVAVTKDGVKTAVSENANSKARGKAFSGLFRFAGAVRAAGIALYMRARLKSRTAKRAVLRLILALSAAAVLLFALVYGLEAAYDAAKNALMPEGYLINLFDAGFLIAAAAAITGAANALPATRRLFKYHAAEHMAINCAESGIGLSVENILRQPRVHPRCGTATVTAVFAAELVAALVLPSALPEWAAETAYAAAAVSAVLVSSRLTDIKKPWAKKLLMPGLFMQRFVTLKPDEEMAECALEAARAVLK